MLRATHLRLILHQDPVIVGQGDRVYDNGGVFRAIMPLASLGAGAPDFVDASNRKLRLRNPRSFHSTAEHVLRGWKVVGGSYPAKVLKPPKVRAREGEG